MIKQIIKRKQYDKIKERIKWEIRLEKYLKDMDYMVMSREYHFDTDADTAFYCKSIDSHNAKIECLNKMLAFIENEERC